MIRYIVVGAAAIVLVGCESAQQSLKSFWADTAGVHRKAYIYNQYGQQPLMTVEDKKMRIERDKNHPNSIVLWAGSTNQFTAVHDGVVIIQDQVK